MSIKVAIGANFGDEGKGLMTDYFASRTNKGIVVRFNGGAQAGHTVVLPDGHRHVFGHFGSGTLQGLPTYLSKHFVVNPMIFCKELDRLQTKMSVLPNVYIDLRSAVTTPYDIMLNQMVEKLRGNNKHGSCGLGFNETIVRQDWVPLTVRDLCDFKNLVQTLNIIRNHYLPIRLQQLGIKSIPPEFETLIGNDNVAIHYIQDIERMFEFTQLGDQDILKNFDDIVFEGAQGLMLHQRHGFFPYVTRSNTGIENVIEVLEEASLIQPMEVCYVTRAYLTRHGAGPFPTETPVKPYKRIIDLTNVPNPYQGTLRFGLLDIDILEQTISDDLLLASAYNNFISPSLAVTCVDQLDHQARFYWHTELKDYHTYDFLEVLFSMPRIKNGYISEGMTRETIREY